MQEVLLEHAMILRSMADELEAMANMYQTDYTPATPVARVAVETGPVRVAPPSTVDQLRGTEIDEVIYVRPMLNYDRQIQLARQAAREGKKILVMFPDQPYKNRMLDQSNWDTEVPLP